MDKFIGKRLEGRYDILELIGKGGMANVYRAHDIIDDKTVAVKILREEYVNNMEFLRRFKNESKAIAFLNHPNIVKVYDVSFSDTHSIIMEYIDGVTLKEYMEHVGALPWKDAVHFTIQILHALQHAHDKGIVHRDIKPQNIMLLRTGEIKVTDFGIARFARSESRTISDRAIGSVHYISPEQAMGENTDEKSDIYSVGIMLFEMLTGKLPFQADSAVSVAIQQVQSPIERPRSINPEIPIGLEEITIRAVQKDSRIRFQSAAEMIAALEEFRQNPAIRFNYPAAANTGLVPAPERRPAVKPTEETTAKRQKPMKPKKEKKKNMYLRMLFLVTLIVGLGSVAFMGIMVWLNNPFVSTDEGQLPDFTGQKYEDIAELYPEFRFVESEKDYNDEYSKGVIFDQDPRAGSKVKIGSKVKLSVSEGIKEIAIDDFQGQPAARVFYTIRGLGLEPTEERQNNEEIPAGRVISTSPAAGSILSGGDAITVYVSEGPERKSISVPDATGMKKEDAIELLTASGFTVGTITETAHELPAGTVVSQTPQQGSLELAGTVVNLTVSKEGMERYFINVPLPLDMDRDVKVRARIGEGETPPVAAEDTINPAKSSGIWSPSFAGEPGEELRIRIYIDGKLYQEYYLDFTDGDHWLTRDRSDAADFQE